MSAYIMSSKGFVFTLALIGVLVETCTCKRWTGNATLGSDGSHECEVLQLRTGVAHGQPEPLICVRAYRDAISDWLRQEGQWKDCAILPMLWEHFEKNRSSQSLQLFVDVGANIGACTLLMLSHPGVDHVVAFEPSASNLYYLTSSMLLNHHMSQKLSLYPFALSNEASSHYIFSEPGNAGNTVLDKPLVPCVQWKAGDNSWNACELPGVRRQFAQSRTLDQVLLSEPNGAVPVIHLMKLDAQGYEVKILRGATKLLALGAVRCIQFELAPAWIEGHGDSLADLFSILLASRFRIFTSPTGSDETLWELLPSALRRLVCANAPHHVDLVATYEPLLPAGDFWSGLTPYTLCAAPQKYHMSLPNRSNIAPNWFRR